MVGGGGSAWASRGGIMENMITGDDAGRIACRFAAAEVPQLHESDIAVIETETREHPWGWVFFWNHRRFVNDGDSRFALDGGQPVVVLRHTGYALDLPLLPPPP